MMDGMDCRGIKGPTDPSAVCEIIDLPSHQPPYNIRQTSETQRPASILNKHSQSSFREHIDIKARS
jgi:hypothetical protein